MRIKVVRSSSDLEGSINDALTQLIKDGFMIVDYGIVPRGDTGYADEGFIKYCDKQFLREYKIKSIMNEL